jgi:hypothetical protein
VKTAISLLTCDKMDLVEQSIKPLLAAARQQKFDLFVMDGSTTEANEKALWEMAYPTANVRNNVRGGAGAAIVYALTEMLDHSENYDVVGLVESDVLLRGNWLDCLDLFALGAADGLEVGAASARCFVDRVLFQKDSYAVMHNIGAGMIMLTRRAATIVLNTFRTGWTTDNRRIFSQLSGVDIGTYWAFRANEHMLTADWHWDAALAAHGLASLALTPSPVEMIGQNPPLAEQGLEIATGEVATNPGFVTFKDRTRQIREGLFSLGVDTRFHFDPNTGTWTYFPHQMEILGGAYIGDWRLKEARGWGTFAWEAGNGGTTFYMADGSVEAFNAQLTVPVFGPCAALVSGGRSGGKVRVEDEGSGFRAEPEMPPEEGNGVLQLMVPGALNYRAIRITALTPGVCFYGIQSREKQPFLLNDTFDYSRLPKP